MDDLNWSCRGSYRKIHHARKGSGWIYYYDSHRYRRGADSNLSRTSHRLVSSWPVCWFHWSDCWFDLDSIDLPIDQEKASLTAFSATKYGNEPFYRNVVLVRPPETLLMDPLLFFTCGSVWKDNPTSGFMVC
jgi:hypothetical protein